MKLRFLLAFMAIALAGCSGDDDGTTNPVTEKDLKEISFYQIDGDDFIDEMVRFENNRMTERDLYYLGEVFYEDRYAYDSQGRLILRTVTNLNEGESATIELDYDSMGRMTSQELEYLGSSELTTYTYDEPGKIEATIVTYNGGGTDVGYSTYHLNDEGHVTNITSDNYIMEITYEGNNVVKRKEIKYAGLENEEVRINVYEYDPDTEVKGALFAKDFIRFGDNKANYELYNGYDYQPARDRYLISATATSPQGTYTGTIEYDFDNDGFPIGITRYDDAGEEFSNSYITYE